MIIDVSKHNGKLNWSTLKENIEGAIVRCGYGNDEVAQDDPRFKENIEGAIAAGVPVGVYLYSYASNKAEAISEANHVKRLVGPYKDKLSLPIYIDVEEQKYAGVAKEVVVTFCEELEKDHYFVGVYANQNWWKNYLVGINDYTKWVARYSSMEPQVENTDLWQYSSQGSLPGCSGRLDVNTLKRVTLIDEVRAYYGGRSCKEASQPTSVEYVVKDGDTLSAIAKANGTTIKKIMEMNPIIKDKNKIQVGWKLKVK